MQKKAILLIITMFMLLTGLAGCTDLSGSSKATFKLGGLPTRYGSYYATMYAVKDKQVLEKYNLGTLHEMETTELKIAIDKSADTLMVYLSFVEGGDPIYFWSMKPNPSNTYEIYYWIDYEKFNNDDVIKFGISEQLAQDIAVDSQTSIDFKDAPYYLYKLSGQDGKPARIIITSYEGTIEETCSNHIITMNSYDGLDITATESKSLISTLESVYIVLRQKNYNQTTSASLQIEWERKTEVTGVISDLVASDSPELIYGINSTKNQLYYIDPAKAAISQQYDLPCTTPEKVAYSASDKKLFIGADDGIVIWNTVTNTVDKIISTESAYSDIEVSPLNRRIYSLSFGSLRIIDMDSGEFISSSSIKGDLMALDETKQNLFVTDSCGSPADLLKYSVVGDKPTLETCLPRVGERSPQIVLSPDKTRVLLPGNINGHAVDAFSTEDLTDLGCWYIGSFPHYVAFSPDGKYLYGVNGDYYDNYLYVMDAQNFNLIYKDAYPGADYCTGLVVNNDGSYITAFRKNDLYSSTGGSLEFFKSRGTLNTVAQKGKTIGWTDLARIKEAKKVLMRTK